MPIRAEDMAQSVPGTVLANGTQVFDSQPHPLLQQLQEISQSGTSEEVETILCEIVPLPAIEAIPKSILPCFWEVVSRAVSNPDRGVLQVLFSNGFATYQLSWKAVDTAFKQDDIQALGFLIDCGWDVNEAGPDFGMRPLLRHAVQKPEMRRFLLSRGADPHIENNRGLTPLETVAALCPNEVLEELITLGKGDPRRDDSLLHAVEAGKLENAKTLFAHGADPDKLEKVYPPPFNQKPRRTPLDAAIIARQEVLADWLREQGATARNLQ